MLLMKVLISITKSALFQNAAELNDSGASKLNYRHLSSQLISKVEQDKEK
jgi:hypothetical protein